MKPQLLLQLGALLLFVFSLPPSAAAQTTTFTYQGFLTRLGAPVNGTNDFEFKLYNDPTAGAQQGGTVTKDDVGMTNGLFTVTLDFTATPFDGTDLWLDIAVRPGASSGAYTNVLPRQPITATPYAIKASGITGTISSNNLATASVGSAQLADGSITATDLSSSITNGLWSVNGANVYRSSGNVGIGTAAPQGRLDVAGGSSFNDALFVASSGAVSYQGGVIHHQNDAYAWKETADSTGSANLGSLNFDYVERANPANAAKKDVLVLKGSGNVGIGTAAPQGRLDVAGGSSFTDALFVASSGAVSYRGGVIHHQNDAYAWKETADSTDSANLGSLNFDYVERANPSNAVRKDVLVLKGAGNVGIGTATPANKLDVQGSANFTGNVGIGTSDPLDKLDVNGTAWVRGLLNTSIAPGGGTGIRLYGRYGSEPGGLFAYDYANDTPTNLTLQRFGGNVGIGTGAPQGRLDVAGGSSFTDALFVTSSGAVSYRGGLIHHQNSTYAWKETANDTSSTNLGSLNFDYVERANPANVARKDVLVLKGNGQALFSGEVICSGEVTCTAVNITSDRNAKEQIKAVNGREVLDKVVQLPISEWQYKTEADARHMGPMAQDFHSAFALGNDNQHISVVDAGGVALAAIQGLNKKLDEKNQEVEALKKSVAELREIVNQLLAPAQTTGR